MAEQLSATIQKTLELASRCAQTETSDNYGALGSGNCENLRAGTRGTCCPARHANLRPRAAPFSTRKHRRPLRRRCLPLHVLELGDTEFRATNRLS